MCPPFANIAHFATTPPNTIPTASIPTFTTTPTIGSVLTRH